MMVATKQPNGEPVWLDRNGEPIDVTGYLQRAEATAALSRRHQALLAAAGESGPARSWYVLAVEPTADIPVENDLSERKVETWLPTDKYLPKRRAGRGGVIRSERFQLATPGYVFVRVEASDDVLNSLSATEGVVEPIGGWGQPWPVKEPEIRALRDLLELSPKQRKARIRAETKARSVFVEGDKVTLVDTAIEGIDAIVLRKGRDGCLHVEAQLGGNRVAMDVPVANLRKSE